MAHLMPYPKLKFFDSNGEVLVGGKLYSYIATTSTPQATYTDQSEATPNANPQILDANGEATVWVGTGKSYKIVLTDPLNVVLWTIDNVTDIGVGEIVTAMLANGSVTTVKILDGNVTTAKILDGNITTAKIADGAVTPAKIPDGSLAITKLTGATDLLFKDTSDGLFGGGVRGFPHVPWEAPGLIANPTSLAGGDGLALSWSPNGRLLAFAENAGSFASFFVRSGIVLKKFAGLDVAPAEAALSLSWSPNGEFISFAMASSPYFKIFQRTGNSFALLNVQAPAGAGAGVAWSPNGEFVAIAHATSPFVTVYQRSLIFPTAAVARYMSNNGQSIADATFQVVNFEDLSRDNASAVSLGPWTFRAQRSNGYRVDALVTFASDIPATMYLYKNGSIYSMLDRFVAAGVGTATPLCGSDWVYLNAGETVQIVVKQTTGIAVALATDDNFNHVAIVEDPGFINLPAFTILASPGSLPAGIGKCAAWSPDSRFLAIGHATTPFVTIYERTGTSFAKCADPVVLPAAQVNGLSWSPDGLILTCAHGTTPFVTNYARTNVTFTKLVNPVTLPTGAGNGAAWDPSGELLAIAHDIAPFITIYSWDGSLLTKLANATDPPAGNARSVSWTLNGEYLAVAHQNSPYLSTYRTTGQVGSDVVLFVKEVNLV